MYIGLWLVLSIAHSIVIALPTIAIAIFIALSCTKGDSEEIKLNSSVSTLRARKSERTIVIVGRAVTLR